MASTSASKPALGESSASNAPTTSSKGAASAAAASAAAPAKVASLNISDFAIGKPIGSGRYGKVFRVKHLATGKLMVMKVIDKKEVIRDGVVHQLRREIEIHSRCRHENIVKFFCYFHDEERICIVLEYCNGKTLLELMARQPHGRIGEDIARQFLHQLVSALTYLREGKAVPIIHRDIKPENILFVKNKATGGLTLKLADFGWAVQHVPTSKRTTLCGTPEYLPPEVCLADRYSGAFDIWTLGVLMYEMLVGTTPFAVREDELEDDEDIQQAIVDKILSTKVIPVPDYFSDEAKDLVLRLMDRNPSTRILLEEVACHPFLTGEAMPLDADADDNGTAP